MKKIISLVLILTIVLSLASCGGGGISGTYSGTADIVIADATMTFKFSGDSVEVSLEAKAFGGFVSFDTQTITGSYTLGEKDDGSKTICFDFDGDTIDGINADVNLPFEQGNDYIKIAGITYTKVK